MKKYFVALLLISFSLNVLATKSISTKKQDFNTAAFELLAKNLDTLKMEGDVIPGEKLKPIIGELAEFIRSRMFLLMGYDPEDYTGPIKNFTAECGPSEAQSLSVECQLIIQYKPLEPIGETGISFYVGLDKDRKPESILENRVQISRGH